MENIIFIDCPYRTDAHGRLMSQGININIANAIVDIKNDAMQFNKYSESLYRLIYTLEKNLIKFPKDNWLDKNRNKLRDEVWTLPELKVGLSDTDEDKKRKLILGAKLMELIES